MKKIIRVNSTDRLFKNICENDLFTCEEITGGLRVRYNGMVAMLAGPIIRLTKLNENEIRITFSPNGAILIVTLLITAFFWAIAYFASEKENPNMAGTVIALLAPSVMWLLDIFVMNRISKLISEEIEAIADKQQEE